MPLKLGNARIVTYPKSKCNLNGLVHNIYSFNILSDYCPICGGPFFKDYVYAFPINKDECVKLVGNACRHCDAFFTRKGALLDWLEVKREIKIIGTYNCEITPSGAKKNYQKNEHILIMCLLIAPYDIRYVSITDDLDCVDVENNIYIFDDPIAVIIRNAIKKNESTVNINEKTYVMAKILIKESIMDDNFYLEELSRRRHAIDYVNGKLPPFSSNSTIYVYNGNITCHTAHHLKEVKIVFTSFDTERSFFAEYCYDCRKFVMKYDDYEWYLKKYKLFPIKVKLYDWPINGGRYDKRAEKSPLKLQGYDVDAKHGLSREQRQQILAGIIDYGIMSKRKVLDYLEMFIREHSNLDNHKSAVSKWQADKEYVLNYTEPDCPKAVACKVEKYNRRI